jgi:hypothetical protein
MIVTIWFLTLLVLPVILFVYEDKRHQEYLAELEILDEPYRRLLEAGAISAHTSDHYEYRS